MTVLDLILDKNDNVSPPPPTPIMLPPETLELILSPLNRRDLLSVLTANTVFHNVAARMLYRSLTGIPSKRAAVIVVRTLARNDLYPPFVREIDLDLSKNILTGNFLRLLHRALKRLKRLSTLTLEFSTHDNSCDLAWILQGCSFSLRSLTTSMRCESMMAQFLETQYNIVEICLRGLHPVPPGQVISFPLASHALPRLRHFRTVLSAPEVVAAFLRGRPIESVSMAIYPGEPAPSLNALLVSSQPVRRLTVMSFDVSSPVVLIAEIASRIPSLEALHTVALIRNYSHASIHLLFSSPTSSFVYPRFPMLMYLYVVSHQEMLIETASSLAQFKKLKYLTFMAPGALITDAESEIAALWHRACPTLKTIILPKGIVWGYVGGRWISLQDAAV